MQDEGKLTVVEDYSRHCVMAVIHYLCSLEPVVLLTIVRAQKTATTNFQIVPLGGTVENHRIK